MYNPNYPNLQNMVQTEGVCPICLMDMSQMPTYQCENGHTMCHRCKPYYFACSVCQANMNHVPPPGIDSYDIPPPIHFMPHPMPMPMPSAPSAMDFIDNERGGRWGPPSPAPDQNLVHCQYSIYGCWVKVPVHLSELHETRCQFRPFLEVEHLPTDIPSGDELVPCDYSVVGCDSMMPIWRKHIHEPLCIFKERFEALNSDNPGPETDQEGHEDPDELVQCKFKIYGCLVEMPRRRKTTHELNCNYNKYYKEEDFEEPASEELVEPPEEEDPESLVDCCWAEQGCRVRPKLYRKEIHEGKCNYRLEECVFKDNGCEETFIRARKFAHERICEFRD